MEIPKIEISAEKIVDKVLDEIEFKGKSIREWAEYLIRNADDLISRQALIEAINAERKWLHFNVNHAEHHYHMMNENSRIIGIVWNLPSIQPEQKTGRWILNKHTDTVLCSQCGKCYGDEYNYCPNCGAKMEDTKWPYQPVTKTYHASTAITSTALYRAKKCQTARCMLAQERELHFLIVNIVRLLIE